MADFVQTMKGWRRMCKFYTDKSMAECRVAARCDDLCPLGHNTVCGIMENALDSDLEEAMKEIEKWAAEHPEPVYPTWREYLQEQGILDVEYIPAASSTTFTSRSYVQTVKTLAPFYRPIPADTANKLGIKPKEDKE